MIEKPDFPDYRLAACLQAKSVTATFAGWTGACTGAAACIVTMDGAKSVTATFTQAPPVQRSLFLPLVQR